MAYNNPCCGRLNCGDKLIRGRWCLETCFIFVLFVHFSMAADCWVGASFSCEDAFPSAVLAAFRHCAAHAQEFRHSLASGGIHLGASVVDSRDVSLFCAACLQHRSWDYVWCYRYCVRRVCRGSVGNAEILGAPTHVCPQGLEMTFLNILQKFRPRKNRVSISDSCESKFRSVVSLLCVQFSGQCV